MESRQEEQVQPGFRVYLCGPFRLERRVGEQWVPVVSEWNKRQSSRMVFKALLGCPDRQARRDALLTLLWPDDDPHKSGEILKNALTSFRKIFAVHFLEEGVRSNRYQLQGQKYIWVDVDAAFDALHQAEQLGRTSQEAFPLLEEAVNYLKRGSYLEEEEGLWLYDRRKEVNEALYNARLWLAEAFLQQGLVGQAEIQWHALLATDPIDEDVLEMALTHLQQRGLTAKALRLYTHVEARLAKEEETLSPRIHALAKRWRLEPVVESEPEPITSPLRIAHHPFSKNLPHSLLENSASLYMDSAFPSCSNYALWFGEKVASFFTLIDTLCGLPDGCLGIQEKIGKALHAMPPINDDGQYMSSRRQLLIALATLPSALLFSLIQGPFSSNRTEQFLAHCSASLTACWHLMRGSDYAVVEEILPTYLPFLAKYVEESSKHQYTAARLATQGYRLKGILALHHNDTKTRDVCFQQAVTYAEFAKEPGLLAAALISLGYHKIDHKEAELLYQKACVYAKNISPLQRSRLYAELAVVYAQTNQQTKALGYLELAQQNYPAHPELDSSFLYAEFSPSSLMMETGRVHLALLEHHPEGQHAQDAWEIFADIETPNPLFVISERIRCEVLNYQAKTALALEDRDLCCAYLERGAQGAVLLKSAKRQSEVLATRNKALLRWPHDRQVKELKRLFID